MNSIYDNFLFFIFINIQVPFFLFFADYLIWQSTTLNTWIKLRLNQFYSFLFGFGGYLFFLINWYWRLASFEFLHKCWLLLCFNNCIIIWNLEVFLNIVQRRSLTNLLKSIIYILSLYLLLSILLLNFLFNHIFVVIRLTFCGWQKIFFYNQVVTSFLSHIFGINNTATLDYLLSILVPILLFSKKLFTCRNFKRLV